MEVALSILTACLNISELKEQVGGEFYLFIYFPLCSCAVVMRYVGLQVFIKWSYHHVNMSGS